MSLIVTIVANAKFMQDFSSSNGHFLPHLHLASILLHSISSFNSFSSIEQLISGQILFLVSVKCLSKIHAHNATAHKQE